MVVSRGMAAVFETYGAAFFLRKSHKFADGTRYSQGDKPWPSSSTWYWHGFLFQRMRAEQFHTYADAHNDVYQTRSFLRKGNNFDDRTVWYREKVSFTDLGQYAWLHCGAGDEQKAHACLPCVEGERRHERCGFSNLQRHAANLVPQSGDNEELQGKAEASDTDVGDAGDRQAKGKLAQAAASPSSSGAPVIKICRERRGLEHRPEPLVMDEQEGDTRSVRLLDLSVSHSLLGGS
ncbi:hypothetical protein LTR36_004820 [Oleoguttula mirabilis]|uniref:Uncharacterized protein n=1 Tax=Oleoguttula mirabilis TaxID=1507867 RepID=A0AAV9JFF3_9PEZI|nr:hypothetical protein LTR36_004820 [Oleoguttula mirabilis]